MTTIESLLAEGVLVPVAWALLHFVWQGVLIAGLLWLVLRAVPETASSSRSLVSCLALLMMALSPVATLALLNQSPDGVVFARMFSRPMADDSHQNNSGGVQASAGDSGSGASGAMPGVHQFGATEQTASGVSSRSSLSSRVREFVSRRAVFFVSAWLLGVVTCSIRLLSSFVCVQKLRRSSIPVTNSRLLAVFDHLRRQLLIGLPVRLMESAAVQIPVVVGWLKPLVILPMMTTTGLSAEQMEVLLAHELAHVRRCDFLVNLVQTIIETVLFYHPAVWWVSRRIREERELCCDAIALQVNGDRTLYASSLFALAQQKTGRQPHLIAADGGSLVTRIRRILQVQPVRPRESTSGLLSGILALCAVLALIGLVQQSSAGSNDATANGQSPAIAADESTGRDAAAGGSASSGSQDKPKASELGHPVRFVIAQHVTLYMPDKAGSFGARIINWDEVEGILEKEAERGLIVPKFLSTNGGLKRKQETTELRWTWWERLHEAGKLNGVSQGILSPRAGARYDLIRTAEDLTPDDTRKVTGTVTTSEGQPVPGAEVFVLPKEDATIYLQEGRNRNPLEELLVQTADDGSFITWPADSDWFIAAAHPLGFRIQPLVEFKTRPAIVLQPWARVSGDRPTDEPADQQEVSFTCCPVEGLSFQVYETPFSDEGTFEQAYLPPGRIYVQRRLETGQGRSMSFTVKTINLRPGESLELSLGDVPPDQFLEAAIEAAKNKNP